MVPPAHANAAQDPDLIRVLIVEDSRADATLLRTELRRGGLTVRSSVVDSAETMATALRQASWDAVICDHRMPRFDVFAAFRVLREIAPELPLIVVSGAMHEELAVALLRQGAHDFVPKHALARLVPAVERAVLYSRTIADLKLQVARASDLSEVGRLAGAVAADVLAGLNQIEAAAANLTPPRTTPGGPRPMAALLEATARIRGRVAALEALGGWWAPGEDEEELGLLLRRSEPLLTRLLGPNTRLSMQLWKTPLLLQVDATEAQRVVVDLVLHARGRMSRGGEITVHTGLIARGQHMGLPDHVPLAPQPYALLTISDEGPIVASEDLRWLAEAPTSSPIRGAHPELAPLAGFIGQLGGLLWAEGRHGAGMSWNALLPCQDPAD